MRPHRPRPISPTPTTDLGRSYVAVRAQTEALAAPLSPEDCALQSMPDASPVKWHLAHTTWFFETFVLEPRPGFEAFDPAFRILFNSYYVGVGDRHARPERGLLSRPDLLTVLAYRAHVDAALRSLLAGTLDRETEARIVLGLHHEQQHQELIVTDLKHLFSRNPTAKFAAFVDDGGYRRPELWLSADWDTVTARGWTAPLYWSATATAGRRSRCTAACRSTRTRRRATSRSTRPTRTRAGPAHGCRPSSSGSARRAACRSRATLLEGGALHPMPLGGDVPPGAPALMFGDVWEWTRSDYGPYPGYAPEGGALGEYNGRFMAGQYVLRGGSCATPRTHLRATYRNFFAPDARWQFSGVRLAGDI